MQRTRFPVFGGASGTMVLDDVWRLELAYANRTPSGNWTAVRQNATAASNGTLRLRAPPLVLALLLLLLPLL